MTKPKAESSTDGSGPARGGDGVAVGGPKAESSTDGSGPARGGDGAAVSAPSAVFVQGAEACVEEDVLLGRALVRKTRLPKGYRHPVLDARLRDERTRDEANLLMRCRTAGVPVPVVYDIDRGGGSIVMERITGRALRDVLPTDPDDVAAARLRALGVLTARMHGAGVTHGDLTTSNVMVPDLDPQGLVLIDFGLGQATEEDEPRGVDLHLVEEALEATEARAGALLAAFLEGYGGWVGAASAVRRLEAIRLRGRYREAT